MLISRQCVINSVFLHHYERNTIHQTPFFIGPIPKKRKGFVVKLGTQ